MPDQMTACQIAKQLIDMVFLKSGGKANGQGAGQFRRSDLPRDKMVGLAGDIS
jgi:hypothetical protein